MIHRNKTKQNIYPNIRFVFFSFNLWCWGLFDFPIFKASVEDVKAIEDDSVKKLAELLEKPEDEILIVVEEDGENVIAKFVILNPTPEQIEKYESGELSKLLRDALNEDEPLPEKLSDQTCNDLSY